MLLNNHVIVIFYAKTVYFFIHLKNVFMAFFLFFVHFPFFSLRFVLLVICSGRKFIAINAAVCPYCNKEIAKIKSSSEKEKWQSLRGE